MSLGLMERLGGLVTGLGRGVWQVPGLTVDLMTMRADDNEDWDSIRDILASRSMARASSAFDELASGGTGISALTHDSPVGEGLEQLRGAAGEVGGAAMEGLAAIDRFGGEWIREPMSSLLLAGSLASSETFGGSPGIDGIKMLAEGRTWRVAREMANDVSMGQAMWLMLGSRDILDPDEVGEWADSSFFHYATGTTDALARFFVDPDVLAAKAARAGRLKYLVRDLRTPRGNQIDPARVDTYFRSDRWRRHNEWMEQLPADPDQRMHKIAREFFPPALGDGWRMQKAHLLGLAPDAESRELVLRAMMGDLRAAERIKDTAEKLRSVRDLGAEAVEISRRGAPSRVTDSGAARADRLDHIRSELDRTVVDDGVVSAHLAPDQRYDALFDALNDPSRFDQLDGAVRDVARLSGRVQMTDELIGHQTRELRRRVLSGRTGVNSDTSIFQSSAYDTPMRFVNLAWWRAKYHDKRVHPLVDVGDPQASDQLDRMLRGAGVADQRRASWIRRLDETPTTEESLAARANLWDAAVEDGFRHVAQRAGIPREHVDRAIARMSQGRQRATNIVQRAYATGRRDLMTVDDPVHGRFVVATPMTRSQQPEFLTAPDFQRIGRDLVKLQRAGRLPQAGMRVKDMADSVFNSITWYWKANVLLRPAWPLRVTGLDETLRNVAKLGAVAGHMTFRGMGTGTAAFMRELGWVDAVGKARPWKAGGTGATVGGLMGGIAGGPAGFAVGAAVGGGSSLGLLRNMARLERAGMDRLVRGLPAAPGVKIPTAFGEPGDLANRYYRAASSGPQIETFMRVERDNLASMRRDPTRWRTVNPEEAHHEEAWMHVLNRQWRDDLLVRRILEGEPIEGQKRWLTETREGLAYARGIPHRRLERDNLDDWLRNLNDYVDETVPTQQLRRTLIDRQVESGDLAHVDATVRPSVHGAALDEALGKAEWLRMLDAGIERVMRVLGTMPTDHLVRHRAFEQFYKQHLERTLPAAGARPTQRQVDDIAEQARRRALTDVRDHSYDLAERRELHHLLRHWMPFLPAMQEVASTWLKIALEKPDFAVRAVKAWTGMDKWDQIMWTDPDTDDRYLTFPIPEFAKGLVDHSPVLQGAFDEFDQMRLPKTGFNLILQSPLGFGPYVQAAVSEVVRRRPTLAEAAEIVIPFGPSESVLDAFTAAWQRRLIGLASGRDDRQFAASWNRIFQTKLAAIRQGEREPIDFDDPAEVREFESEVDHQARAVHAIGMFASASAPTTPIFDSQLWPYIEAWRALSEMGPIEYTNDEGVFVREEPFEIFVDQFGEELADATTAITRTNDGVPPTLAALEQRREHADIVERWPDLGGFVVGDDPDVLSSKFQRAVYDHQLTTPVAPGASEMMRERMAPTERREMPDIRLGWTKYSRLMDWIEAERVSRGLPNLQVREAADLAETRRQAVAAIGEAHPAWARERENVDRGAFERRLEGFRAITADPKLSQRDDVQAVDRYLKLRDRFVAELARRQAAGGSGSLYTVANRDLQQIWLNAIHRLIEADVAFGPVFYRYFEHDPMTVSEDEAVEIVEGVAG